MLHGHLDVVPGHPEQFTPRVEGDRLIGRGAYDMKGGLAAMMCALHDVAAAGARARALPVRARRGVRGHRHARDRRARARGLRGDFAITGEPTDLHVGVQAKGVLRCRIVVRGRAAHGSTPWLGDNAVLKAIDVFRRIETMPFSRESTEMFDRPSINLGRIQGGDAVNKVPDECTMAVDIRYLPGQEPGAILEQIRAIPDIEVLRTFIRQPAYVSRSNPYVMALCDARRRARPSGEAMSVGRDGASDAISFLEAGRPGGRVRPRRRRPPRPRGVGVDPARWRATAGRSWTSSATCPAGSSAARAEARRGLRAVEGGLA